VAKFGSGSEDAQPARRLLPIRDDELLESGKSRQGISNARNALAELADSVHLEVLEQAVALGQIMSRSEKVMPAQCKMIMDRPYEYPGTMANTFSREILVPTQ
jgi:hypothetical protein